MTHAFNLLFDTPLNNLRTLFIAMFFAFLPSSALATNSPTLEQGSDKVQISQQKRNSIGEPSHTAEASPAAYNESISHLRTEVEKLKSDNEKLNSSLLALEKNTEAELERTVHFLLLLNMALYLSIVVAIVVRRFM